MKLKKKMSLLFSASMVVSSLTVPTVYAAPEPMNLAKNKPVTDTGHYSSMPGNLAVDGKLETRWSTENAPHAATNHSIVVNLEKTTTISEFKIYFEEVAQNHHLYDKQRVRKFKIEGSNDGKEFELIHQSDDKPEGYGFEETVKIESEKSYQYVKLTIESLKEDAYPSISVREFEVYGTQESIEQPTTPLDVNLAFKKQATASNQYEDMVAEKLTDGNYNKQGGRWSSEKEPIQWFYVDLGKTETVNRFKATWESEEVYASGYKIYVSDDVNQWGDPVVTVTDHKGRVTDEKIKEAKQGRYVKVEVTNMFGYPSVSCCEFEVFNDSGKVQQDPLENVALNKTASANGYEDNSETLAPAKAFDGNLTKTRWASKRGHEKHWLSVDLGSVLDVQTVRLVWETQKANDYVIQYTEDESVSASTQWKEFKSFKAHPATTRQTVSLEAPVKARHVRVFVNEFTDVDPGGKPEWDTISLYEMEVYGGIPKSSINEDMDLIAVTPPKKGDQKIQVSIPTSEGYDIKFNGADYEQLVDENLNIHTPIVDQKVKLSFKAVNQKDPKNHVFKEIEVTIPGEYTVEKEDNKVPKVLPELREWKGHTGDFIFTSAGRIVIKDESLKDVATTFQTDLIEATGKKLEIVVGESPKTGDIALSLGANVEKGLGKEGYIMTIGDYVNVEAEDATGAFFSTRTILQVLKVNSNEKMPKGITRDYPLYRVRGFILDVGRKTFTMDNLTQLMKQMSYYKLNDFHVHLNDNLIPLEHYNPQGNEAIMNAYSGFRLESDIKKGGKNGLYKADLTSKDVYYSKEEFRNFIQDARVRGVNIVPEIDVPAHSLALTRVRPDLRHGLMGRDNDHLNLTTKYDDSLAFVKDIFNEYIDGKNPVFDAQTTVHFGADEYTADKAAYRRFVNDMISYMKEKGRQPRVWGSLSTIKADVPVSGEGVEMNIWNNGWADFGDMYDKGFDLINCIDSLYYIVPNAGYYYDYLNASTMYGNKINSVDNDLIPAGDPQMAGASFAVWNDMCDYLNNGITEWDIYDRVNESLPLFAANLWGKDEDVMSLQEAQNIKKQLGDAPGTNFSYHVEADQDGIYEHINGDDRAKNVNASTQTVDFKNAIQLQGEQSYVQTALNTTIGLNTGLKFKIKRTSSDVSKDQILFESAYGKIIGVQKDTGKFAIHRENFDLVFDYELPINEWVEIELRNTSTGKNNENYADLFVNGKLVQRLGDDEKVEGRPLLATTMIPFERIGSKENAFVGYIDDIVVLKDSKEADATTSSQTMNLDYAMTEARYVLKNGEFTDEQTIQLQSLLDESEVLLKQAQPSQTEVERLEKSIRALLKDTNYTKADYTQVEALLSKISSLEIIGKLYSASSIEKLNKIVESIRYDLPQAMQETIDAYAKALNQAILALEPLDGGLSPDYYYTGPMKGTASSHQDASSDPNKALDNNPNTMWHSKWSIETMPHWFQIELDEVQKVDGLYYLPRQTGGNNGTCTKYQIEVSQDGKTFKKVKEGELKNNSEGKLIEFEAVDAKFVKFTMLEAYNNNGSAAELKVHILPTKPDIAGLQALYNQAMGLVKENYVDFTNVEKALVEAKKVLDQGEGVDYQSCQSAKIALREAIQALKIKDLVGQKAFIQVIVNDPTMGSVTLSPEAQDGLYEVGATITLTATPKQGYKFVKWNIADQTTPEIRHVVTGNMQIQAIFEKEVDFIVLKQAIEQANKMDLSKYTEESVQVLKDALEKAKSLDDNAKQQDVDDCLKAIQNAVANLKLQEQSTESVDKSALETLINQAEKIAGTSYTSESYEVLKQAVENAKKVLENADASKEQVEAMIALLQSAIDGLVKVPVATGDSTKLGALVATLGLATAGIYLAMKKKKEDE